MFVVMGVSAQTESTKGYEFTKVKDVPATPVKNQYKSGTCWSFSGLGMLEAEVLRMGKGEHILSDMFIVRYTYLEKAIRYVRFHGSINFSAGGAFHDVTHIIKKYGIVPEEVYSGLQYGTSNHEHGELDAVLKAYADAVIKNANKQLSPVWLQGYNAILDTYFGPVPEKFTYKGKEYTPKSYAASIGLNPDDYVEFTSFTHHPFYTSFILEIPDNWLHGESYNVPLNELEEIIDYAINNDYPIAWASDVSEKGFSWRNGVAIVPELKVDDMAGTERERWEKLTQAEKDKEMYSFDKPIQEKEITQENRQEGFDNYTTTDDHGMIMHGIYKDQNGNKFYKIKNSWDVNNPYDGYFFASKAFVLYKTTDIMLHKNAVPKAIAKKLNLK